MVLLDVSVLPSLTKLFYLYYSCFVLVSKVSLAPETCNFGQGLVVLDLLVLLYGKAEKMSAHRVAELEQY